MFEVFYEFKKNFYAVIISFLNIIFLHVIEDSS